MATNFASLLGRRRPGIPLSPSGQSRVDTSSALIAQALGGNNVRTPLGAIARVIAAKLADDTRRGVFAEEKAEQDKRNRAIIDFLSGPDNVPSALQQGGGPTNEAAAVLQAMNRDNPPMIDERNRSILEANPEIARALLAQRLTAKPQEKFEPITDARGNIVGQRSTLSGKVIDDPRAKDAPKFQTDAGKLQADIALAEQTWGKDSPQARAVKEAASAPPKPKLTDTRGMRQEFTKVTSDFRSIRDAFVKVREGAENPSAAGDLGMVFNFMKMLDPGSVVREGEFATAQSAAGAPERVRNLYNRILSGERLTPDQRKDFLSTAKNVFDSQLKIHEQTEQTYRDLAKRSNFDPGQVVIDFVGDLRGSNSALDKAREAISKGADPEAVKKRLRDAGIDPEGL